MTKKSSELKYKQRFERLNPFVQLILIGFFSIIFILGLIALLPLPELGIPAILISLSVLSFRFKWAEQLLAFFEEFFSNKAVKITGLVFGVCAIVALVLWWLR